MTTRASTMGSTTTSAVSATATLTTTAGSTSTITRSSISHLITNTPPTNAADRNCYALRAGQRAHEQTIRDDCCLNVSDAVLLRMGWGIVRPNQADFHCHTTSLTDGQ